MKLDNEHSPFHFQFQFSGSWSELLGCGTSLLVSPNQSMVNLHLAAPTMSTLEVNAIVIAHHLGARDVLVLDMLESLGCIVVVSHTSGCVATTENQGGANRERQSTSELNICR